MSVLDVEGTGVESGKSNLSNDRVRRSTIPEPNPSEAPSKKPFRADWSALRSGDVSVEKSDTSAAAEPGTCEAEDVKRVLKTACSSEWLSL